MRSTLAILITTVLVLTSPLFADRPVAQWDVVPYQTLDDTFTAGVVAFHVEGVKVEFRINSTLVHTAENPTYNPRTDVWEYVLEIDPADYSDGLITVDARAICLSGDSVADPDYDLPTQSFYANSGGTLSVNAALYVDAVNGSDSNTGTELSPYATLAKAVSNIAIGGTVYLNAGTYSADALGGGHTREYWTTITTAPGVDRSDVIITKGRPSTQRLHWKNVKIISTSTSGSYSVILTGNGTTIYHHIWLDNVEICNIHGRYAASTNIFNNSYVAYLTDCYIHNVTNGPGGKLLRGIEMETITSDAWSGSNRLVVNSSVTDIDPGSTGAHPDFHQAYRGSNDWFPNSILYNVSGFDCNCQGLFGSYLKDSAFVNVLFERVPDVYYTSQYSADMKNVIFAHVNIVNQSFRFRGTGDSAYNADEVYVINSIFNTFSYFEDADISGINISYNHFMGGSAFGSDYTTGSAGYVDPSGNDFNIDYTSTAYKTGVPMQCVPADINGKLYDAVSPNKGCYAAIERLGGDTDNNGTVDITDFLILKYYYGKQAGAIWEEGDFDGNGVVNISDFLILKANYGKSQ